MEYKSRVPIIAAPQKNILRRHFFQGLMIIGILFEKKLTFKNAIVDKSCKQNFTKSAEREI